MMKLNILPGDVHTATILVRMSRSSPGRYRLLDQRPPEQTESPVRVQAFSPLRRFAFRGRPENVGSPGIRLSETAKWLFNGSWIAFYDGASKVSEGRMVSAVESTTFDELPQTFDQVQVGRV